MSFLTKLIGMILVAVVLGVILAQSQGYYNDAARKNQMQNGSTVGKTTEELKRNLGELREENEKHPAPMNAPVEP